MLQEKGHLKELALTSQPRMFPRRSLKEEHADDKPASV